MYMLSHLTSHVSVDNTGMQGDHAKGDVNQVILEVLDMMFHKENEDDMENPNKRARIEDLCTSCDMAFQDARVLNQHNVEIHSGA